MKLSKTWTSARLICLLAMSSVVLLTLAQAKENAATNNTLGIAKISSVTERLERLKLFVQPFLYKPQRFQFMWVSRGKYDALKDRSLDNVTWEKIARYSKENNKGAGLFMSKFPTDTASFGNYLLVVRLPDSLRAVSMKKLYDGPSIEKTGYLFRAELLNLDLLALGLAQGFAFDDWLLLAGPGEGIAILSGERFLSHVAKDPSLAEGISAEFLQLAKTHMSNPELPRCAEFLE